MKNYNYKPFRTCSYREYFGNYREPSKLNIEGLSKREKRQSFINNVTIALGLGVAIGCLIWAFIILSK